MSEKILKHYGTPRHSGRYPWGSGENPYQRNSNFLGYVQDLRKQGMSDSEIAKGMGISTTKLRARYSIAKDEKRMADAAMAIRLKEKGYSNVAIAKRMGLPNESSVRSLLDPAIKERSEATRSTANVLKKNVDSKGFIDVGVGTERHIGVSSTKLATSVAMLEEQGYVTHNVKIEQLGTGKYTTTKVLCPPGTTWAEVQNNQDKIKSIAEWSDDGGKTYISPLPPKSIKSDRVMVRYKEDGGADKDGVIELRRGVDDISLGDARYAQVRIAVDGTHYLKGMAVYNDNMPKGVDVIFNTNKDKTHSKLETMKEMKVDKDGNLNQEDPFGAVIKRQRFYIDKNGEKKQSCINIVNEEGDWESWKRTLSSQVLSKQSKQLAEKQLALRYDARKAEFDEIMSLTNPVVRQKLLNSFADSCDSSAVHLEAAALPRQAAHVILPLTSLKDNEIYAPKYNDGETVVLIRYPHGGKFEIPELKVNNKNPEGKKVITNKAVDAVGINSKVAAKLSGADFDGDTVLVIPNRKGPYSIATAPTLKGLENFDPKERYPGYKGMTVMDSRTKGLEMGKVSNLITDMTLHGASESELAAAVRHSMVVIDAQKHELNYEQSYIDNGIANLQKKYQGKAKGGASTIISRASSEVHPNSRRETIDKNTGKKIYIDKPNDTYKNKDGKIIRRKAPSSTKMAETEDAFSLISEHRRPMEIVYAKHANKLKDLANEARRISVNTEGPKYSPSAKETYKKEVSDLNARLNIALKNAPLERQAQILAKTYFKAVKESNPAILDDKDALKKEKGKALTRARDKVGAKKEQIIISDKEWEAIQAGAVSKTTLAKILDNADQDRVKELAMPKNKPVMDTSRISRAKAMLNAGCTQAEVANILGVSTSTLSRALK